MKNNSSNNNFSDLIPINLKSFSLSQFKSILEYHCVYKNDSPYEVLVYDCNKNIIDKYFEFELYFDIHLVSGNPEYNLSVNILREDIIAVCTR
jgi:hypothetical protein